MSLFNLDPQKHVGYLSTRPPTGSPMGPMADRVAAELPGLGGGGVGIGTALGRTGTAHLASQEFVKRVDLIAGARGIAPGSDVALFARYRSYFADPDGTSPDVDPTGTLPFGPGWLPSWGEALLKTATGPEEGEDVQWVDAEGAVLTVSAEPGAPASTQYVYLAHKGSRLLWDNGTWYRELPDRVRIEYEGVAGSPAIGQPATRVKRVFYGHDPASPVWEIRYAYTAGSNRLASITDSRGYELKLTWTDVDPGSGTLLRVTKVGIEKTLSSGAAWPDDDDPSTSYNWSKHDVVLGYDAGGRLTSVDWPKRAFVYDQNANGTYDANESLDAKPGLLFGYGGAGGNLLLTVTRKLSTGNEVELTNTYGSPAWRLTSQVEGSGASARSHTFSVETSPPYRTWTDPQGIVHRFLIDQRAATSPRRWVVTEYRRTPGPNDPRPASDPDKHGELVWKFSWSGCACDRLASVTLPPLSANDQGRRIVWTHDSEGRGFVTKVELFDRSGGGVRTWSMAYEPWGDPFGTLTEFRMASRLKSYTPEAPPAGGSATWLATFLPASGTTSLSITATPVSGPQVSYVYDFVEDGYGRIVSAEEPVFATDTGTGRAKFAYAYGSDIDANDYGLVNLVRRHGAAGATEDATYAYSALGDLRERIDAQLVSTSLRYDAANHLTKLILPAYTTANNQSVPPTTIDFTLDFFGQTARVTRTALRIDGTAYAKATVVSEVVRDFFGDPVLAREDAAALNSAAQTWLTTSYGWDKNGRLVRVDAPGGRSTKYVLDDQDMIYKLERLERGGASPQWAARVFGYTPEGGTRRSVDATGLTWTRTYDAHGRLETRSLQGSGKVWRYAYDLANLIREVKYELGGTEMTRRSFTRDPLGRVLTASLTHVQAGNDKTRALSVSWNGLSRVASVTDPEGRAVTTAYDAGGLLASREDSLNGGGGSARNKLAVTRDLLGRVIRVDKTLQKETSPGQFTAVPYRTDFVYDSWGRVREIQRFGKSATEQATRRYGYDSLENAVWFEDGVGKVTERDFDAPGRVVGTARHPRPGTSDPVVVTTRSYEDSPSGYGAALDDVLGNVVVRHDARGNESRYLYDRLGRLVERRLPGYDGVSHALRFEYFYDQEGRLAGWIDGNETEVEILFDAEKRVVHRGVKTPTAQVSLSMFATYEKYAYDDANRAVTAETWYGGWWGQPAFLLVRETSTYDGLGRLLGESFGFSDNGTGSPVATKALGHGYAIPGGGEDTAFRRQLDYASGWSMRFTPDGAGKLAAIDLKAPGSSQWVQSALYRYEGERVYERDFKPGSGSFTSLRLETDLLGYLDRVLVSNGQGSGTGDIYTLDQDADAEGNVTKKAYTKVSGAAGDWFELDGFDRLKGAKLGVQDFSGSYSGQSQYDRMLTYALDTAQNRTMVTDSQAGQETYVLEPNSNRYAQIQRTVGGDEFLVYDGNGNLIADSTQIYVYDFLDRLSEVYRLDGGQSAQSQGGGTGTSTTQTKKRKLTKTEIKNLVSTARAGKRAFERTTLEQGISKKKAGSTGGGSSQSQSGTLYGAYGYDPSFRRVWRSSIYEGTHWYVYDGWQVVEDCDAAVTAQRVHFDGIGIDEHLGFAVQGQGGAWTSYAYVQDSQGSVVRVLDASGSVVERYEYGPHGPIAVYDGAGVPLLMSSVGNTYTYTGRRIDSESSLIYY